MKRSRINVERMHKHQGKSCLGAMLTLGGLAAGSALLMRGCDASTSVLVLNGAADCGHRFPAATEACNTAYRLALDSWHREAPRYSSAAGCEYYFGEEQCEPSAAADNTQAHSPVMSAFMMANTGSQQQPRPDFKQVRGLTYSRQPHSPSYRQLTTANGKLVGSAGLRHFNTDREFLQPMQQAYRFDKSDMHNITRGGFGHSSTSGSLFRSWGG